MRYDIQLTPNPGLVNHLFDPISAEYTSSIKNVIDRVQPRVAFSWSPLNGTVVRGGYGLFSALNQGSTYYAMRVENGVVQLNYTYNGCKASVGTGTSPAQPFPAERAARLQYPNFPYPPSGPALSGSLYPSGGTAPAVDSLASTAASYSFHGLDPNFVPPFAHEMNLSLEQAHAWQDLAAGGLRGHARHAVAGIRRCQPGWRQAKRPGAAYAVQDANNNMTKQFTVPVYRPADRRNTALGQLQYRLQRRQHLV